MKILNILYYHYNFFFSMRVVNLVEDKLETIWANRNQIHTRQLVERNLA